MRLINITRWPSYLVFLLAGLAAVFFAFGTVNLFFEAMASVDFLAEFGLLAIQVGALWQVLELSVSGFFSLACWLTFKTCERELEDRYFEWAKRKNTSKASDSGEVASPD